MEHQLICLAIALAVLIVTIIIALFAMIADNNFYKQDEIYPELTEISDSADILREELDKFSGEWKDWPEKDLTQHNPVNDWKVIPLFAFGKWSSHCDKFPQTVELLEKLRPKLRTAGFSRLGPGTKLKPHRGWAHLSNKVIRCHYGLHVPTIDNGSTGNCYIECGGNRKQQLPDQWLIFDDSKVHSAANESTEVRIVLLLDMERPWWVVPGNSEVESSKELEEFIDAM